jgi:uncharacterized RDD family membrane protein YckC
MTGKKDKSTYVNPFLRGGAAAIDMFVTGFIRIVFAQILGYFWVEGQMIEFLRDFKEKFGVALSPSNLEHVQFIANHSITKVALIYLLLILLVGALYHAYFNSSTWSATVGKRVAGIVLVKNEGKSLTFSQSFWHYCLSIVPWIFMVYILLYQSKEKTSLQDALIGNNFNLVLGLITVAWIQIHIITKKKNTVQDMIIGCTMTSGRVGKGLPKIRNDS